MDLDSITSYIYEQFPIAVHLGAKVKMYDKNRIVISSPLAPNRNHTNTAFGGSVSTLAILSCWTFIYLKLKETNITTKLLIQKSFFKFEQPIDSDFEAVCIMPKKDIWDKFINTLKKHSRARITVSSSIIFSGKTGGFHEGMYVASIIK